MAFTSTKFLADMNSRESRLATGSQSRRRGPTRAEARRSGSRPGARNAGPPAVVRAPDRRVNAKHAVTWPTGKPESPGTTCRPRTRNRTSDVGRTFGNRRLTSAPATSTRSGAAQALPRPESDRIWAAAPLDESAPSAASCDLLFHPTGCLSGGASGRHARGHLACPRATASAISRSGSTRAEACSQPRLAIPRTSTGAFRATRYAGC